MTEPAGTPEVVDLLVVGGGPAGTAAAFCAQELGIKSLVIDYDDLMKRIRDYPKDKLILPDFGGGDKMAFPRAGDLIEKLCFDAIDKDEMCVQWKGLYDARSIPYRTGVELTGLEPDGDVWAVHAWDHTAKQESLIPARHVVLALGRGVPRRFDIPGNTDGIAFRLDDPSDYLHGPVCVIGGGTSAAEAVIAVSRAKVEAKDPCAVYWSYRGDRLPRVSKALAEDFFEAYVGNGNIRYFRCSEPAAVVTGDDRREYLSVRVDRVSGEGRPAQVSHLEFQKELCIACIGEDMPEPLLNNLGIHMKVGGPKNKKRMVVNRFLESCQPHVYIAGDMLSQAYLETEDFDADPAGFREISHRGNIKAALRDGVLIAGVVRQRLDGATTVSVTVEDAPAAAPAEAPLGGPTRPVAVSGPPPESLPEERREETVPARLVRVLPGGVTAEEYPVPASGVLTIGRQDGDLSFPEDTTLSDRHASVALLAGGFVVRDDGADTGVFVRLSTERTGLVDGDLVRTGRQFLLFRLAGGKAEFDHYAADGTKKGPYVIEEGKPCLAGRLAPDFTLDADDKSLSRRHLSMQLTDGRLLVRDLNSVNGSFLRVTGSRELANSDEIRVGQQTLRLVLSEEGAAALASGAETRVVDVSPDATRAEVPTGAAVKPPPAVADAAPALPATTGELVPSVTFEGLGTFPVQEGQTLCEVAEANGIDIVADCHSGICGSDPIQILSGAEHLTGAPEDDEKEALEDICELDPGSHRLACMACVKGPVVAKLLEN